MKTVTKLLMGAAAIAATVGAAHAAGTNPSSDNSQILFFVTALGNNSTYTVELSQTINGSGGYLTSTDAAAGSAGTLTTVAGDTNFSYSFAGDTALSTFLSANSGATIEWGLISGAYSGGTATSRAVQGNTLMIVTGNAGSSLTTQAETTLVNGTATQYNTDFGKVNTSAFDSFNGTTNGIFGTTHSANGSNLNTESLGFLQTGLLDNGTAYNVYGFSSQGTTSGHAAGYVIGTATFNGTSLVFTGEPAAPVPLPAAAWLFGSGLLGLLGIGRRKDASAV